jgi:hypothetical protein
VVFQKPALARRERTHIEVACGWHAHPLQGRPMRDWRNDQRSVALKADESPIEEVVNAGCQQQSILTVQPF